MNREDLCDHLVASRLAGDVQTSVANTKGKIARLLTGDPECTFGLHDWQTATFDEVARTVLLTAGASLDVPDESRGYIDPQATLDGVDRYADLLAPYLAEGGARVLLATGHPTGLLFHYLELARALEAAGNQLVTVHDDGPVVTPGGGEIGGRTTRFVGRVGCVFDGMHLVHSHLSAYMEVMLEETGQLGTSPDLVIGDHGMAGAAVARGIPTLSIADVNDPALPLAHTRGYHPGVFVIDDNLTPAVFEPITRYILERACP